MILAAWFFFLCAGLTFILTATDAAPSTNLFIVGGEEAEEYRWRHQVSLQYRPSSLYFFGHICGASLISQEWVLTAAHCVYLSTDAENFRVVLGEYDTSVVSGDEQQIQVSSIHVHPEFVIDSDGFPNDIALLKLSTKAQITAAVAPVAIPDDPQETFINRDCWILGWGLIDSAASALPNKLQEANITVISHTECVTRWSWVTIATSHLCAYKAAVSPCNGDSGGPLVCKDGEGIWRLAGVTSWGVSTCSGNYPAVNTRVSSYSNWINETISGD